MKRRISDEDGINAGVRNVGRLALAYIPFALGMGVCVWLGFWMSAHGFFNQLSQEERRAVYVGAAVPPTSPIRIVTPNKGCVKITRVDLDGSTAALYFTNTCNVTVSSLPVHWQLVSPDGTMLASNYYHADSIGGPSSLAAGSKGEAVFSGYHGIELDKRAESIELWVGE